MTDLSFAQQHNVTDRSRKKYRPHRSSIGQVARFRPDALAMILSMGSAEKE